MHISDINSYYRMYMSAWVFSCFQLLTWSCLRITRRNTFVGTSRGLVCLAQFSIACCNRPRLEMWWPNLAVLSLMLYASMVEHDDNLLTLGSVLKHIAHCNNAALPLTVVTMSVGCSRRRAELGERWCLTVGCDMHVYMRYEVVVGWCTRRQLSDGWQGAA